MYNGANLKQTKRRVIHEVTQRTRMGRQAGRLCHIGRAVARQPGALPGWASSHDLCRLETGSKSNMGRCLIHMDAQDAQDFLWRWRPCSPKHPQIRKRSSPESTSCAAASRPDYPVHPVHPCSINRENRIEGTWSLFRPGHQDSLFRSRMIRPTGRGPTNRQRCSGYR